jgi:cell division septal protein FtsQ
LDKFFFSNPAYNLAALDLELDEIMTEDDLRTETGIVEGKNIFEIDIEEADRRLRAIPMVADVSIEKLLPDRVRVVLHSRQPVAWVSSLNDPSAPYDVSTMLLVDGSGFLMRPRLIPQEFHNLPVIYGVNSKDNFEVKPLQNDDLKKAIALLDEASSRPNSLVRIRSLNISKGYCIDALTDQNARIKFGRSDFHMQIDKLQRWLIAVIPDANSTPSISWWRKIHPSNLSWLPSHRQVRMALNPLRKPNEKTDGQGKNPCRSRNRNHQGLCRSG